MTGLEFIDALVGHLLSWPVVVFVALLVFRRAITERIRALRIAKVGSNEFAFGDALRDLEGNVDGATGGQHGGTREGVGESREPTLETGPKDDLLHDAEENPSSSILIAWERFVQEQGRLAEALNLPGRRQDASEVAKELARLGTANRQYIAAVQELRAMRNAVAHGAHVPTPGEAVTYVRLADELRRFAEVAGRGLDLPEDDN
jgi:hypothetical protein